MKKLLIANRGEIALRVMRTAKKMGIATVAVYSEADRNSPHVMFADEAVCLGAPASSESYLSIDKIIEAAKNLNVDAIHPGYGFLSENAVFAERVVEEGIIFVGPKSHAIRVMGSKLAAKDAVKQYDIPMVPGVDSAITDIAKAKEIAERLGYPILIKASAGGGGKGMRIVHEENEFEEQMNRAVSEAESSFGDGAVFIEKYIASPRHIEIQVLADKHKNVIHLFERECSIQRRHQKVVEEAPSTVLSAELREEMGEAAVKVAQACDYVGAGTVEFLLDEDSNFYFLEMNTRLQVEHPVTEMVSGLDLVALQIKIADGEPLDISQEDLAIDGHAIELRVYAEDPTQNFLPSVGILEKYVLPQGPGIRVDDGFKQGMEIPIYYDPMIAKLIAHGKNRTEAIQRMRAAIKAYHIEGVATTLDFGAFVLDHPAFISGQYDTHFVSNHYSPEEIKSKDEIKSKIAALIGLYHYMQESKKLRSIQNTVSSWNNKNRFTS